MFLNEFLKAKDKQRSWAKPMAGRLFKMGIPLCVECVPVPHVITVIVVCCVVASSRCEAVFDMCIVCVWMQCVDQGGADAPILGERD